MGFWLRFKDFPKENGVLKEWEDLRGKFEGVYGVWKRILKQVEISLNTFFPYYYSHDDDMTLIWLINDMTKTLFINKGWWKDQDGINDLENKESSNDLELTNGQILFENITI